MTAAIQNEESYVLKLFHHSRELNMCQICIEYSKQKLSIKEALHNLTEIKDTVDEKHYDEVYKMLKRASFGAPDEEDYWEIYGFGD